MANSDTGKLLDFTALIEDRTRYFCGRDWVFRKVDEWLGDGAGARVFLLTGSPGSGKTAVAARIAQASLGGPALPGCSRLQPGFLTYYHFCQAGRDSTLSPMTFVQGLSEALANRFPTFRAALEQQGSQRMSITATVNTGAVAAGATVAAVSVEQVHIEIHGDDPRAMFDEAVRRPLTVHAQDVRDPIVVLVDSLDEAFTFGRDRNIAQLLQLANDFPPQVRFLLSCRSHNDRVFRLVGPGTLDLTRDAPPDVDEVRPYALRWLEPLPEPPRSGLAAQVAEKSRGNFMYAYYVLHDLLQHPPSPDQPFTLEMPDELEGVYRGLLQRELAADGSRWAEVYRPLLGAIAVGRGDGLTKAQLMAITRLPADAIDDVLNTCREYLTGGDAPDRPYRVYHHSFREFLLQDPVYQVYPAERHAAIAMMLLEQHGKAWKKCEDEYALRYTPLHLAEAARAPGPERDTLLRKLVELTGNQWFQQRCDTFLHDRPVLHEHVRQAVAACAWSDHDDMLPWLVQAAHSVTAYRDNFLAGESVTARAEAGNVDAAQSRLPLFGTLDRDWQVAASLIIAWLAAQQAPDAAKTLIERVAPAATAGPLPLLLERVRAALAGQPMFAYEAGPVESPEVCEALVRRLAGQTFNRELLVARGVGLSDLQHQNELIAAQGYAAQLDGPVLVNSAREYGEQGTLQVDGYIDAHAGYTYVEYRNRSLWVLLEAVLRHHPGQQWVRARLKRILHTVLMQGGAEFTEMAPLVTAALHTRSHGGSATAVIADYGAAAHARLAELGNTRGANDVWSLHRRRLTCLLENVALVAQDAPGAGSVWQEMQVLEDKQVLDGHAGFRAPADLRLADALRACSLGGGGAVSARLESALQRAHHIQDYRFCARITARCNALRRWHALPLAGTELADVVERFAAAPADDEFAPDHMVGEQFHYRAPASAQLLSIDAARDADTLERLADVFQRPPVEFLRLNENFTLSRPLPPGTQVKVPDPGFTPLLAVHLATRVAVDLTLDLRRVGLIRSLVPASAVSATALDSVLGYLLLTADPEDPAVWDALATLLGPAVPGATPPSPGGEFTMIPA